MFEKNIKWSYKRRRERRKGRKKGASTPNPKRSKREWCERMNEGYRGSEMARIQENATNECFHNAFRTNARYLIKTCTRFNHFRKRNWQRNSFFFAVHRLLHRWRAFQQHVHYLIDFSPFRSFAIVEFNTPFFLELPNDPFIKILLYTMASE